MFFIWAVICFCDQILKTSNFQTERSIFDPFLAIFNLTFDPLSAFNLFLSREIQARVFENELCIYPGAHFSFLTSVKLIFNLWPLIYFRKGFNSWKFVKSNRNWPCSSTDLCSNHIQHQLRFVQELPFLIILIPESIAAKFIIKLVTFNYEH